MSIHIRPRVHDDYTHSIYTGNTLRRTDALECVVFEVLNSRHVNEGETRDEVICAAYLYEQPSEHKGEQQGSEVQYEIGNLNLVNEPHTPLTAVAKNAP